MTTLAVHQKITKFATDRVRSQTSHACITTIIIGTWVDPDELTYVKSAL